MSELFKLLGTISVTNADANNAIDETTQKVQVLKGELDGVGGSSNTASDGISSVGTTAEQTASKIGSNSKLGAASVWFGNMATKVTTAAARLGKEAITTGFNFNSNMESYEYQFTALLNDADKAKKLVADLQTFAKETPLSIEGITGNAVSLLSSGTPVEDIIPTLEMLGNLSLGDANKMNSITRAYYQIMAKDKLLAQEMNQLTESGVPIIQLMTEYGGKEYADGEWYNRKMKDSSYEIPFEDFKNALMAATSPGGKWHNYMYTMMDSWGGQTDRAGEQLKETLGAATKPFFDEFKTNLLPTFGESLDKLGEVVVKNEDKLNKAAKDLGETATSIANAGVDLVDWALENEEGATIAGAGVGGLLLKGLSTKHPIFAALTGALLGVGTIDKLAALSEMEGTHFIEQFTGGDSEHSGWLGELKELPSEIDFYNQHKNDMTAGEKQSMLLHAIFPGLDNFPKLFSSPYGLKNYGTDIIGNAVNTDMVTGLTAQMATMVGLLEQIAANGKQPIILNTGALVGGIAPALNSALGQIVNRGNK